MRVAQVNMFSFGSTGKIMLQIADEGRKHGYVMKTYSAVPFDKNDKNEKVTDKGHKYFGTASENKIHFYLGAVLGVNGLLSCFGTIQLISDLKKFKPDIIHLHNFHKFCLNYPLLFRYIKKNNIQVVWTFHDCWPFTGKCPHFEMAKCYKWETGCHNCPQLINYPKSVLDTTKFIYKLKQKTFTDIDNLLIVTPSEWLESKVKESFFKNNETTVIHNGIDLEVFKPRKSDFRKKFNCENKKIVLGVAFDWGKRKGLDVFNELAEKLSDEYQIVLVGVNDFAKNTLSTKIISIPKTQSQEELAGIYSAADVFVNPTREEVLGLVNIEALACGTPVVTFNAGGSPETIDATCGITVEIDDVFAMKKAIEYVTKNEPFSKDACLNRAAAFDKTKKFEEYIKLYEDCTHSTDLTI